MATRRMTFESYKEDVLRRNKKINTETVNANEKLERELRNLGIWIKPSFNLEHALERSRTGIHIRDC